MSLLQERRKGRTHTHTHTHTHTSKQCEDAAKWAHPEWWLHSLGSRRPTQLLESVPSVLFFLYFIHFCWVPEGPPSSWNPCPLYYSSFISSTSVPFHELAVFLPIQNPQKFWSPLVYILWILWESTPLATRTLRRFFLGKRISIPAFCWGGQLNP